MGHGLGEPRWAWHLAGPFVHAVASAALAFVFPALFITRLWHGIPPRLGVGDPRVARALGICGAGTLAVPLSAAMAVLASAVETLDERRESKKGGGLGSSNGDIRFSRHVGGGRAMRFTAYRFRTVGAGMVVYSVLCSHGK